MQSIRFKLEGLHIDHPGIVKIKGLVHSYCYWCNIDSNIKYFTKIWAAYATNKNKPLKINHHPQEWLNGLWQTFYADYAGPLMDKMFLIISDPYSK